MSSDVNAEDVTIVPAGAYFTVAIFWVGSRNSSLRESPSLSMGIIVKGLLARP